MDLQLKEEGLIPRPYQTEMEEIAFKKNTILYLPTGSGKTFIAIRLIARFKQELEAPWENGGKRTFFLVNTVPLVKQQKKVIEDLCPVKEVIGLSSEDQVDYWNKEKWNRVLCHNQVLVMTSQILADVLTHKYIDIENINLLIFDECHHAIDDHPMRQIMKHFDGCPKEKQPRILGLTATLLNANANLQKVEEVLRKLEITFQATIATVNALGEVLNYSTNPFEVVLYYKAPKSTPPVEEAIVLLSKLQALVKAVNLPHAKNIENFKLNEGQRNITTDPKKMVKVVYNMMSSIIAFIKEMGVYSGNISVLAYIILLEQLKRRSLTKEEEMLYKFTITHLLEVRIVLSESMKDDTGYMKIIKHSSQKVLKLLDILKEYSPNVFNSTEGVLNFNHKRKPLSGIIFTKKRFTAKILYNLLKDVIQTNPFEFDYLKHDFIVGFNINPFNKTREQFYTKKQSQLSLLKFANKDLNCLISTSVIEEGVDIPQCLLVLRFDAPLEYRSYVQSKGRARNAESLFVILEDENNKNKFSKQYEEYQKIETYIQKILVGSSNQRICPTTEEVEENLYNDSELEPYVTENGIRLNPVSAISLLSRYCAMLPHDQFTLITPMWIQEQIQDKKTSKNLISIMMPIACPIKEPIKGEPIVDIKNARRSAALNACIKLHQIQELDRDTLLPRKYGKVDFDMPDVKECFPNWPWEDEDGNNDSNIPQPGTKKRVRKHRKMFPWCLNGSNNWKYGTKLFYLHIIQLNPVFAEPQDSRERALYIFLKKTEGFGFLTTKPLPKICNFPIFLTVGEVMTSVKLNYAHIELDLTLFEIVKEFHFFVFDQILEVAKRFLTFDGTKNSMYVVPVHESDGYDINWDIMRNYNEILPVATPSIEERRSLRVNRENYQYTIVTPWYRAKILPDRYVVSDVLEYMTAQSLFDSDSYETYAEYYASKYNLNIEGRKDQPLLEVRNINTRMNCLLPRAPTIKSFTEKQQKLISAAQGEDKPKGFSEIFIPEFCIKYDFPAVLWYKATMLPSIIHRVFMLLVAEELRAEIAVATQYGQPVLPKGEEWLPLEANMTIVMKSLLAQVENQEEQNNALKNNYDRINNPIDEVTRKPKIMTMKESVYQLQKQKINKEYPWEESTEPVDIERNLATVTVMEIECYDKFITEPILSTTKCDITCPEVSSISTTAAILPPPIKYNDKIQLLSKSARGRGPELRDILSALTTSNSNDNFNLEQTETLGDSFLKYAATLYLFHKFSKLNEGQLTNIKCRLVGNRNLFYAGEKVQLGGRMKVEQHNPRNDFLVPAFFAPQPLKEFIENSQIRPSFLIGIQFPRAEALCGELSDDSWTQVMKQYTDCDGAAEKEPCGQAQNAMQCYIQAQAVSDKSVADCVEALIGTYLLSGGVPAAIKIVEWLKVIPQQDNLMALLHQPIPTVLKKGIATEDDINRLLNDSRRDIEDILNYKFKDPSFLLEAMSHPSYIRNRYTTSYERLEFIGDAILDFLITSHIFENYSKMSPGELTDLRSALVNNVTFAAYVVKLKLHKYICSQLNPLLDSAIMAFVEHQEQREHEIVEDVLYLIEEEECQIAEYVEVPKVLSDVFESLAGAIYLDSGANLETVWSVIYPIMHREISTFSIRTPQQPVRLLQEMIYACPSFGKSKLTTSDPPKVMIPVTFTRTGQQHTVYGVGGNKFQAKRAAAKLALKLLMCK